MRVRKFCRTTVLEFRERFAVRRTVEAETELR